MEAITCLGSRMLYSIVLNITLTKLFTAKSSLIKKRLKDLWVHNRKVSAVCYVLSQRSNHLKKEEGMLAGLIQEIGSLPLYLYADRRYPKISSEILDELISEYAVKVGVKLLESWNFPHSLIDVIKGYEEQQEDQANEIPSYVDVVKTASLIVNSLSDPAACRNSLASEALGLYSGDCKHYLSNNAEQVSEANAILAG